MDLLKQQLKRLEQRVVAAAPAIAQRVSAACDQAVAAASAAVAAAAASSGGGDGFVHPGTMVGPQELALLRARAAAAAAAAANGPLVEPEWLAARDALLRDARPVPYHPHALADVHTEWEPGPKVGHDELVEQDGAMCYRLTCAWLVTGDARYAASAAGILGAWATQNRALRGKNAPLEAGWAVASFARCAELLKRCGAPCWTPELEAAFLRWVRALVLPALNMEHVDRLPLANWHTTIAEAKAQLAVLTGDRRLFDEAVRLWRKVADAYLRPCGECGETSRDLFHSQFGLGGLVQLAELAWHQGLDLYSHAGGRLAAAMEFHAYITLGGKPPECGGYALRGIGFLPCGWEMALNHYQHRCGRAMPQTAELLRRSRPERYVFHWGLGTLTHFCAAQHIAAQQEQQQRRQQQQQDQRPPAS